MKKFITLLLVLTGMVSTVSATNNVTIYFQPNSGWADANARFIVALYSSDETFQGWGSFTYDSSHSCYSVGIDTDATPKFQFVRKDPTTSDLSYDNKWGQTPSSGFGDFPTKDAYIYLTGTNVDGASWNTSLLPWNYYFYGNLGENDDWCVGDQLTASGNVHTGTLSGKAGKNFIIYAGSQINYWTGFQWDNNSWDNAIRPNVSKTIDFESVSNLATTSGGSNNWYINTTNEGDVQVSYNSADNNYSVTCTKTATISATPGYATYSNGEKYTVSGAEKIYVATGKGTNTIELTVMPASTVFAANVGVILKGSGDVTINSVGSEEAYDGTNYLVGSGNNSMPVNNITNVYVFSWDGTNASSVGFYEAENTGSIAAHKAYLNVTGAASRFLSFSFTDESTGISEAAAKQNDNAIYNRQGVRMNQFNKGLNIVNGKKVLVK